MAETVSRIRLSVPLSPVARRVESRKAVSENREAISFLTCFRSAVSKPPVTEEHASICASNRARFIVASIVLPVSSMIRKAVVPSRCSTIEAVWWNVARRVSICSGVRSFDEFIYSLRQCFKGVRYLSRLEFRAKNLSIISSSIMRRRGVFVPTSRVSRRNGKHGGTSLKVRPKIIFEAGCATEFSLSKWAAPHRRR
jgi:hypothetical protein